MHKPPAGEYGYLWAIMPLIIARSVAGLVEARYGGNCHPESMNLGTLG